MAYSGPVSVSTLDGLLSALVTWAVANAGFTDEGTTSPPSGAITTYMYRVSKGGMYWYFYGGTETSSYAGPSSYIALRAQTVLPDSSNYSSNSYGPSTQTRAQLWGSGAGPYVAYNFFTEGTCVHIVVEAMVDIFSHFSFGKFVKFGTWTGGEYTMGHSSLYSLTDGTWRPSYGCPYPFAGYGGYAGNFYGGRMYYPYSSAGNYLDWLANSSTIVNNFLLMTLGIETYDSDYYRYELVGSLHHCGINSMNNRALLIPQYLRVYDPTLTTWFLGGYAPNVCYVNIQNLANKEIVAGEWEVFPVIQRTGGDSTKSQLSGNRGLAYRRA